MKLLRQASIILGTYFLGELLQKSFNLPVPGSVIGMLILLGSLYTGLIKLDMIEEISDFLLDHLAFFFIPAGVGLISSFSLLRGNWFAIITVSLISTIIVLVATGVIVQIIMKGGKS